MVIESAADATATAEPITRTDAQEDGMPFLIARGSDRQLLIVLEVEDERLWIGRESSCDIVIDWDDRVSGTHAELVRVADGWAVTDDGLSLNGTFVGSERVIGRRRLHDGEVVRVGHSSIAYRSGAAPRIPETVKDEDAIVAASLTPKQREVLVCLCRPLVQPHPALVPATNRAIADELVLSVEAIRSRMRKLFEKFDLKSLPQNKKRATLAKEALRSGAVSERDLDGEF